MDVIFWLKNFFSYLTSLPKLKPTTAWFRGFLKTEMGLVYTTLGTMGSSLLGGVFWLFLASFLNVEDYGLTNYYIALASIFSAIALMGLDATVITFMAKGEKRIWYQANSLILVSGLVACAVLSAFQWGSGILSVAMVFFMMGLAEALGRKRYREYAFLSIGQRIAQILFSIALYFPFGILGIVFGYFLGNILFSYRFIQFLPKFTTQFGDVKVKRAFVLHSYGFNLVRNFTMYFDKIIIAPVFGYYVLGLYQLGFQFFMFLSIIPLSLYYYLLPEESSGRDKKRIKIAGLTLAAAAGVLAFFVTPYLIERLFPTFIGSIWIVRIMCLAVIPSTVASVLNATLLGRGGSKPVLKAGLLYMAVLIAGLMVLGQVFGAFGLAVSLVIAQSVQAVYLLFNRKFLKNRSGIDKTVIA